MDLDPFSHRPHAADMFLSMQPNDNDDISLFMSPASSSSEFSAASAAAAAAAAAAAVGSVDLPPMNDFSLHASAATFKSVSAHEAFKYIPDDTASMGSAESSSTSSMVVDLHQVQPFLYPASPQDVSSDTSASPLLLPQTAPPADADGDVTMKQEPESRHKPRLRPVRSSRKRKPSPAPASPSSPSSSSSSSSSSASRQPKKRKGTTCSASTAAMLRKKLANPSKMTGEQLLAAVDHGLVLASELSKKERERMSAYKYRNKRKGKEKHLESKVQELERCVSANKHELCDLRETNQALEEELSVYQAILNSTSEKWAGLREQLARAIGELKGDAVKKHGGAVLFALFALVILSVPMAWPSFIAPTKIARHADPSVMVDQPTSRALLNDPYKLKVLLAEHHALPSEEGGLEVDAESDEENDDHKTASAALGDLADSLAEEGSAFAFRVLEPELKTHMLEGDLDPDTIEVLLEDLRSMQQ